MLNDDRTVRAKIFNEFAEIVHGLLIGVFTLAGLRALDVVGHGGD